MPCCFVPGCKSSYRSCKEVRRFFFPPKDKAVFQKWCKAIPRKDRKLHARSYVCDIHFFEDLIVKADKFIIDGKAVELPRKNWRLTPDAIPHIFPNLPQYLTKNEKKRKTPTKRTSIPSHRNVPLPVSNNNAHTSTMTSPDELINIHVSDNNCEHLKQKIIVLSKKLKTANRYLTRIKNQFSGAKAKISLLEKEVNEIKKSKAECKCNCKFLSKKQKLIIDTMVKKCQVKDARGMCYDGKFLLGSLLFKTKSPKGYRHCLNHELLPLPSEDYLRRLLKGMKCSYGVNRQAVIALQKHFADETDENKKMGILIFDAVKLREKVAFNSISLKVEGFVNLGDVTPKNQKNTLANHPLVCMYVPLLHSWVQPVAVYASRNATLGDTLSKIILQVIIQLE
ncbi:uncharacterized protein [Periplaneta americana]|uniref:uncharacterized protein n=1 Tax=Periplaneta americana TaxID=6978 RepID=UPI0037E8338E